ncbi:dual specificity protein phosphatase family protein [Flavobacterium sp. SM15]|uniref:dual specificity protein phosphatase family protein n=1 Tax=Flavobacterium sp. SM15 TaxID=2908005 RepID=UPI001EDAF171|nr:dual specificity protein phosphatase [Flavobacterium sp. SM15]MCG2611813.1 dual specificity protein phosphatase family protein [Flavobacterium sp. SM15]
MKEIDENLFVGNLTDYENNQFNNDYYFVQACKEPCHRKALGYTGRTADVNHPEYLIAHRERKIILNMIDPPTGKYFENIMFESSLAFINENLEKGNKVLIHCNQGISRSPSIGLLYLATKGKIRNENFIVAEEDFKKIYPDYSPSGIKEFLSLNWHNYFK